jgi:hypothetical protein
MMAMVGRRYNVGSLEKNKCWFVLFLFLFTLYLEFSQLKFIIYNYKKYLEININLYNTNFI